MDGKEIFNQNLNIEEGKNVCNITVKEVPNAGIYIVNLFAGNSFVSKKISNIKFTKSYTFEYSDRVYRVQHGDMYDDGITQSDRWMEVFEFNRHQIWTRLT